MLIAFIFSNFIQAEIINLLIKKPSGDIDRNNINSKKLIGIKGYASVEKIKFGGADIDEIEKISVLDMIKKFKNNPKYDGLVIGNNTSFKFVKDDDDIIIVDGFGTELAAYVVNKRRNNFLVDLNQQILNMRSNTRLEQLCTYYYGEIDENLICSLN